MSKLVIDVHVHLGNSLALEVGGDVKRLVEIMDKNAIDKAILSPIPGYINPYGIRDTMKQNDAIAEAVNKYPQRFPCGLGSVEPRYGERGLDEVDRIAKELKLRGLMFHNDWHGVPLDNPIMFSLVGRAATHNMIILAHTSHFTVMEPPFRLARLAEVFPQTTFINAHPALDITHLPHSIEVSRKNKNIYLDTCFFLHLLWPIEKIVKELGGDRLLFGSDIPYYDECIDKIIVERSGVSDEIKEKIFWRHAAKIFGLEAGRQ